MNIKTAPNSIYQNKSVLNSKPQSPAESLRPLTDQWTVGKETFEDTAELLAKFEGSSEALPATYSFKAKVDGPAPTKMEKIKGALRSGLESAIAGTVIGGGVGLMIHVAGQVLSIVPGNGTLAIGTGIATGLALVGAAIGGLGGAADGYNIDNSEPERNVDGHLKKENGHLRFYPESQGEFTPSVDLESYQNAKIGSPEDPNFKETWWNKAPAYIPEEYLAEG